MMDAEIGMDGVCMCVFGFLLFHLLDIWTFSLLLKRGREEGDLLRLEVHRSLDLGSWMSLFALHLGVGGCMESLLVSF
jgi:hypothetical protein